MFRHVLVPTDGSELSNRAVESAVSFAKAIGARITFFYVLSDFDRSVYGEAALLQVIDPRRAAEAADQGAHDICAGAQRAAQAAGVPCEALTTVSDSPYEAIIMAAEKHGCDLILMASHGRRGVTGLLLGSQTQKVLTHSKIPVLVYR